MNGSIVAVVVIVVVVVIVIVGHLPMALICPTQSK